MARGCRLDGSDFLGVSLIGLAFAAWGIRSAWRNPALTWIVSESGAAAATSGKGRAATVISNAWPVVVTLCRKPCPWREGPA